MLKNFVLVAWRNLRRHRILSGINLVGLSLSISFCLLLIFHIQKESSYDGFHKNKDRIFRLEMTNLFRDTDTLKSKSFFSFLTEAEDAGNQTVFPLVVGPDIQANFPEVRRCVRYKDVGSQLLTHNRKTFNEDHVIFADADFFRLFSFPLLRGHIFSDPNTVVISQTTAKKIFGDEDPIGKTIGITVGAPHDFVISGITADLPDNSSIQFGLVLPLVSDPDYQNNIDGHFNSSSHFLMLELNEGVSYPAIEKKLNRWMSTYFMDYLKDWHNTDIAHFHWYMRSLADCHFTPFGDWGHYTDKKNLYQLACLVIIILFIASLNYVLLTISRAAARSQEVGVRKVMGANKKSVILQFWVETQVLVLISVMFGLILSAILLPLFNQLLGTHITVRDFSLGEILLSTVTICIVLGLFAGFYPALLLSRMPPVSVLKNFRTFKIKPRFSTSLVILQYTACVILMISAFVINRQMRFLNHRDLGFDKDQVLIIKNPTFDFDFSRKVKERLYAFAQTQPYVLQYSAMNGGLEGSYNTNGFRLNDQQQWRKQLTVDYNYFEMLGLKIVKGRPFSRSFLSDSSGKVRPAVVNETLFRLLGKTAKIGEMNKPLGETIIGVVKDYNFETLNKKIEPEDHVLLWKDYAMNFMFKVKRGHMPEAIEKFGEEWQKASGDYPYDYTFLDQTIAKMYESDMRWQAIIQSACFFAIFIACLGLFGLSSINAINRIREIGIRKILGANPMEIVRTLSFKFMGWIMVSILIAVPVSAFIMQSWLQDFAYRIEMHWWFFAGVGIVALSIAFFTIGIRAFFAARTNPVKSLRTE